MTPDGRCATFSLAEEDFILDSPTLHYRYNEQLFADLVSFKLSQYLAAMEEGAKFIDELKTTLVECGVLLRPMSSKLSEFDQFARAGLKLGRIHQDCFERVSEMLFPIHQKLELISRRTSEAIDAFEDLDLFSLRFVSIPKYFEMMMTNAVADCKLLEIISSQIDDIVSQCTQIHRLSFQQQRGRLHSAVFPVVSRRVPVCTDSIITSGATPSFVIDICSAGDGESSGETIGEKRNHSYLICEGNIGAGDGSH